MGDRWNGIPDGIDPIVGYRAWYYTIGQRGARLHPLTRRSEEAPGAGDWDGASWEWVTATCGHVAASWHFAPEEDCSCGFYAMSTLPPVVSGCGFRMGEIEAGGTSGVVLGRVELAGKIIEHEWGYRAERARIAELIPFRGTEQSVMILGARLGLPIAEPVDVPSVQDEFAGLARHPRAGPPRFRDYVAEHRWMAATILVGLVVVAMQPTTITTVVLFALLYARKFDHSVAPRQAPTPFPNRARPTLPPPSLPNGSPPAA